MGQKRLINSDVLRTAELIDTGWLEKLLFIAMLLEADDEGCVCCEPSYLKGVVQGPWRGVKMGRVDDLVSRLRDQDVVRSYEVNGRKHLQFLAWDKHQKLARPRPSTRNRREDEKKDEENINIERELSEVHELMSSAPPPLAVLQDLETSEQQQVYERLQFEFHFGGPKAASMAERLSLQDVEDWKSFSTLRGPRLACHLMKFYDRPSQIPEDGREDAAVSIDDAIAAAEERESQDV